MYFSSEQLSWFQRETNRHAYKELFFFEDIVLIPAFLILIYIFLKYKKNNQPIELQKYFLKGYFIRILGIIVFLIHHTFIYKGGVDSFTYYWGSTHINTIFRLDFLKGLKLMFMSPDSIKNNFAVLDINQFIYAPGETLTVKIVALFGLFSYSSYFVICLLLGLFAYGGCWKIFKTLNRLYPNNTKPLALTTLFLPSVFFWSSVISKEIICIGAIGFLFWAFVELFIFRSFSVYKMISLIISIILLAKIKIYILLGLVPALIFLFILYNIKKIKNKFLRASIIPIVLSIFIIATISVLSKLQSQLDQFAFEQILQTVTTTYNYLSQAGFAESAYSLGTIEPNISSIIRAVPASIVVTLFRPFVWEINKPIVLIASLESFLTLCLTLFVLFRVGILQFFKRIFNSPVIFSFMVFSIIFGIAVGLTSGNFGTLMRYKIPLLPFYYTALYLIYKNPVLNKH